MRRHGWLIGLAAFAAACEGAPHRAVPAGKTIGALKFAVGTDVREVGFAAARCRDALDGVRTVELLSDHRLAGPQGESQQPRVLIARLKGSEVLEAHAFAFNQQYRGVDMPVLHMLAGDFAGIPQSRCRLLDDVLKCQDATIVPWLAPGEPPRPSFEVPLRCPG